MVWNIFKKHELELRYEELEKKYSELLDKKTEPVTRDFQERITELEVKMAKLWSMIVTVDKRTEKEKITPQGRKIFGGRL